MFPETDIISPYAAGAEKKTFKAKKRKKKSQYSFGNSKGNGLSELPKHNLAAYGLQKLRLL